jgi:hypothetical protein
MSSARAISFGLFGAALAALLAAASVEPAGPGSPRAARKPETRYLLNRVWSERPARDERELVTHLVLGGRGRLQFGALARASRWRAQADVLRFELDGDQLKLEVPQERARVTFTVRTFPCAGQAPAPFDLCLELRRGSTVLRLYSSERRGLADPSLEAALAALPAEAPACTSDCEERLPSALEAVEPR